MMRMAVLVLGAFLLSGCTAGRVVTLRPEPPPGGPVADARPVIVPPFVDKRGAIAVGNVGALCGLFEGPSPVSSTEPYRDALRRALVAALEGRGIRATAAPDGAGAFVLWNEVIEFYGDACWGVEAWLRVRVVLTDAGGRPLMDKTISRETRGFGLGAWPGIEQALNRVVTDWVAAVSTEPELTAQLAPSCCPPKEPGAAQAPRPGIPWIRPHAESPRRHVESP
jgi:hypothetical protein